MILTPQYFDAVYCVGGERRWGVVWQETLNIVFDLDLICHLRHKGIFLTLPIKVLPLPDPI